jgi:hypothetical protein
VTTPGINRSRDDAVQGFGPASTNLFAPTPRELPTDLWSLPQEPVSASAEERLLAAWIGALAQGEPDDAPADRPSPPSEEATEPPEPPTPPTRRVRQRARSRPAHGSERRRPILATTLLLAVGAAVGAAAPAVLGRLRSEMTHEQPAPGGPAATTGTPPDDGIAPDGRVAVPGTSPDCPMMLVRPRNGGTTADVPGTCFAVG